MEKGGDITQVVDFALRHTPPRDEQLFHAAMTHYKGGDFYHSISFLPSTEYRETTTTAILNHGPQPALRADLQNHE
jgi:hypothetical protein